MRAANNPVGHHGLKGCVGLEEGQNLLTDGGIIAYVRVALGEPAPQNVRLIPFSEENADDDLGG
jgi:hypothetical protein